MISSSEVVKTAVGEGEGEGEGEEGKGSRGLDQATWEHFTKNRNVSLLLLMFCVEFEDDVCFGC